ncbi:glycosyltransferase involved in cell wall biosynthesis [Salinibacter ruber]|uniref:glycosyltransferase family 4 protein n=1 Tax=Salinibacter ruber TaxID=146919 RepID=UPI002168F566|nr:glycosyltransferase family 4 protein [Salinibacter ruber]MCS3748877.1 glycosyltransferase involved in cell wall biosynthesis [Salinibacter ruber]
MNRSWLVAQIGAREHYAIARGLHRHGHLEGLITDAWAEPRSVLRFLPGRPFQKLAERYHPDLRGADVHHFTRSLIGFEAWVRLRGTTGWECVIERNQWFQRRAVPAVRRLVAKADNSPVVFAYSYVARALFEEVQDRNARAVLGQINAGPYEEDLVAAQQEQHPGFDEQFVRAPARYWEHWRQECEMADTIVVNSDWSRTALDEAGIETDKVSVVPLIYEADPVSVDEDAYPEQFSAERPLRVLYLGTLTLRKGIAPLLEATSLVEGRPVEWWIVGDGPVTIPEPYRSHEQIRWVGQVPRSEVDAYYRDADVFILPTISDGFALTQLEAQAQGLPVIASQRCGDVVQHGQNGLRLDAVTPEEIAEAVVWCLNHPDRLRDMAVRATSWVADFREEAVLPQLLNAVQEE